MNGLATALVLVLGLAGGREILDWWRDDASHGDAPLGAPHSADPAGPNDPAQSPLRLNFGTAATGVLSQSVSGDVSAVRGVLRKLCLQAAGESNARLGPPGPGEQKLLAEIAGRKPLETVGDLRLDELVSPVPMMAASRQVADGSPAAWRVAALGIATPSAEGGWTVYVFRSGENGVSPAIPPALPLPPDSQLTMSVQQPDGRTLTAFHGRGKLEDWEQFFRAQRELGHWEEAGAWQTSSDRRLVVFIRKTPSPARCELQFGADGNGGLWGLITASTSAD